MASKGSKRRKVAGEKSSQSTTCPIYDLFPGGILKEVASFLPVPSRALFAVAIAPPISPYDKILARCRPTLSRSPITGDDHEWHTLDFGDIEKELAAKLTDDDISKVLLHIDAVHKVKRLLLTNCVNITGTGLSSLRYSTSIEQIDMSLVKAHQKPKLYTWNGWLSCDQVLPILHSIINHERNALRHVHFPHSWRHSNPANPQFVEFLEEYIQMMVNRNSTFCKKCNTNINMNECISTFQGGHYFGIQQETCSVCTNNYCYDCKADDNHFEGVRLCYTCERFYCSKCSPMVECEFCDDMYCVGCAGFIECGGPTCRRNFCDYCIAVFKCRHCDKCWCPDCDDSSCYDCGQRCCAECSMKEGVNGVHSCNDCRGWRPMTRCDKCRMKRCLTNEECKSCAKIVSSLILEQNKKLKDENKSLKEENEKMKSETKNMKASIRNARMWLREY